jgi:hypothetical protein
VVSAGAGWVPAGAWTLLWKEWITLGRGRLGPRLVTAILVGAFLAGAVLAVVAGRGDRGAGTAATITGLSVAAGFAIAMSGAVRLAADLRSPIWWLSASGLRARLATWTLAGALKAAAPFAAAGLGASLAARTPLYVAAAPVALAACWLLRATALAVYSLLPAAFDLAGPGRMLRGIAFYILMVPLITAVVVVTALTRSFAAGAVTLAVLATLEGAALIYLAAWRIDGNGVAFALAERR